MHSQILNFPFPDSFVIGLYGEWGEGKSTVLRFLRNRLIKDEQDEKIVVVEFDPWYFASKEAILNNFLYTLESKFKSGKAKKLFRAIKKPFNKYRSITLGANIAGFGGHAGVTRDKEDILELKTKIDEHLKKLKRKIVILIDEVDRLEPKEILMIFKIVKLVANFKNTIFILSFDPKIVTGYLKEEINVDPAFLEKIVQRPIHVPDVDPVDIAKFLLYSDPSISHKSMLDELFEILEIEKYRIDAFNESFPQLYNEHIKKLFRTLRDSKRYINALSFSLPSVKNEVNLFDFSVLEIIKVFAPLVYDDIYDNWYYYVEQRFSNENHANPLLPTGLNKEEERKRGIREHIDMLLNEQFHGNLEEEKKVIKRLLCELFPTVNSAFNNVNVSGSGSEARQSQRIHSLSFPKYFMLKTPNTELSDEFVSVYIERINNAKKAEVPEITVRFWEELQGKNKLVDLLDKLLLVKSSLSSNAAEYIVRSACENIKMFRGEGEYGSECDSVERLVLWLIDDRVDDVEGVLGDVLRHTPSLIVVFSLAMACKGDKGFSRINSSSTGSFALEITLRRLKEEFIDKGSDFFVSGEPFWLLCDWLRFADRDTKNKVQDYFYGLVDTHPQYIGRVVNIFVTRVTRPTGETSVIRFDSNGIFNLFNGERFCAKAIKLGQKVFGNEEEKEALELLQKTDLYKNTESISKEDQK